MKSELQPRPLHLVAHVQDWLSRLYLQHWGEITTRAKVRKQFVHVPATGTIKYVTPSNPTTLNRSTKYQGFWSSPTRMDVTSVDLQLTTICWQHGLVNTKMI